MRTRRNIFLVAILISLSFLFSGCASDTRREEAEGIARHAGLIRENIQAPPFLIATWSRITPPVTALHVYIEGDGFAWKSRTQPSNDPTPNNPTGLKLAAADANANVLYLARPCQFITPLPASCRVNEWTSDRFAPEIVKAMNDVLNQFVQRYPGVQLDLVGYSGGGNIAALLAARRKDVHSLRTVAGNLDVAYVNAQHHVTPMPGALNAIDSASSLRLMPQIHFSGERDETVSPEVARRFQQAVGGRCVQAEVVGDMTHGSDWAAIWPRLLGKGLPVC
ncbi:alpha/beta hydrolase [Enterobacter sp. RHBSTW-00994]|nr:alpha/beta hydrolase [Enterobacter sp. RHBSTW-00994]QLR44669.1 alpha/beta hydrolase [Enterobacter sp. RHBSTW-00994]